MRQNIPFLKDRKLTDEIRELHGQVEKMMIYDIEYWVKDGKLIQRKIYTPLHAVVIFPPLRV